MILTVFWTTLTGLHEILVALAVISVLRRPREPRAMSAWILALVFLPVVGLLLFVLLGEPRLRRTRRRRRRRRLRVMRALRTRPGELRVGRRLHFAQQSHTDPAGLMRLATRMGRLRPSRGNQVTIYQDADRTFADIISAIQAARSHVHLEYYIFQYDETGRMIRDLLMTKSGQGIKCRLLLDDLGCWRLPRSFIRQMEQAGVEIAFFLPVVPWRGRWRVNFRNHRKVLIVDGTVGFTGSQNIGDVYAGRKTRFGPWRDTHMRILGPAVHGLQQVFIEDWHYATHADVVGAELFPGTSPAADQVVQIVPSGPDQDLNSLRPLLFTAFNIARRSISIVTPYFVPDAAMLLALQSAAYRGVCVRLLIPSRSDHRVVLWAGRSYYNEMCRAGVEIYEYSHAMLHSKVLVIDDHCAIVGSANMDERSFRLNFELSTILYDAELAGQLLQDFEALRHQATRIRSRHFKHLALGETFKLGLARLLAPVL